MPGSIRRDPVFKKNFNLIKTEEPPRRAAKNWFAERRAIRCGNWILAWCGPQRKENVFFLTESYCPDSTEAVRTLRRPATENGEALPKIVFPDLAEPPLHQPGLFPPPDPAGWTDGRSCGTLSGRQAALDQIAAEICWRSTQLNKLRRSVKGRVLDCCDYFDGRKFTLQELKRRHTELFRFIDRSAEFQAALDKPTRREARRRKSAPLHLRLAAYLDPIGRAGGGRWKPCPTYEFLADALGVCIESVSQAFKRLEEDPQCPLAFACAYSGTRRCRQKHVAMKSWLKFDGLPLHFEKAGRARKLRPTFRKGVERTEPPPLVAARYEAKRSGEAPVAQRTHRDFVPPNRGGNSGICLSHSIRLTPAAKDNPQNVPKRQHSKPTKPNPRKAAMSRSLENAAWRAAREAASDGELFWDNAKPKIPLPTLKTLILEAFEQGFEWQKHVRPALIYGIKEAHAAACLSETGIRNPGAFAATIFRERIASIRPDLDHLGRVIEARRKPAEPQPYTPILPPPPSASPDEIRRFVAAEERAAKQLEAYMLENSATLAQLGSLEAFNETMMAKLRDFTEQNIHQSKHACKHACIMSGRR